jgi:hypothetical protein
MVRKMVWLWEIISTAFAHCFRKLNIARDPLDMQLEKILHRYHEKFQSNPHALRESIPVTQMWRFLIDGDRQHLGCLKFDIEEPGYLRAMTYAWQKIFTQSGDLTNFSKRLHALATRGVCTEIFKEKKSGHGVFRNINSIGMFLTSDQATRDGFEGLLSEIKKFPDPNDFPLLRINNHMHFIYLYPDVVNVSHFSKRKFGKGNYSVFYYKLHVNEILLVQDESLPLYQNFNLLKNSNWYQLFCLNASEWEFWLFPHMRINSCKSIPQVIYVKAKNYAAIYIEAIQQVKSKLEQLKIIIFYIHQCEMLHPYLDGNTRTYSFLLLNHLLILSGFPLTIQTDPNRIYGYSVNELAKQVLDGMERVLDLSDDLSSSKAALTNEFDINYYSFTNTENAYLKEVFALERNGRRASAANKLSAAKTPVSSAVNKMGLFGRGLKFCKKYSTQPTRANSLRLKGGGLG